MDTLLSDFVARTSADAGLARDLLQCELLRSAVLLLTLHLICSSQLGLGDCNVCVLCNERNSSG